MKFHAANKFKPSDLAVSFPWLSILVAWSIFSACKPPETSQRSRIGGRGSNILGSNDATASGKQNDPGEEEEPDSDGTDPKPQSTRTPTPTPTRTPSVTPSTSPTPGSTPVATPTPTPSATPGDDNAYPTLYFKGKGTITNDGKTYPSTAEITTSIDDDKLVNDVTAVRFIVKEDQKKADKKAAESIGPRTFTRPTVTELKNTSGFNNASFTLYTKQTVKKGVTTALSHPLPMFPRPGKRTRYTELDGGPLVWTASMNGANTAMVVVTKVSETSNRFTLKYTLTIDGDKYGELYKNFPIPKEAVYEIDTENQRIISIVMTEWWKNEEKNKRESGTTTHKLCKQIKSGVTETFPCE